MPDLMPIYNDFWLFLALSNAMSKMNCSRLVWYSDVYKTSPCPKLVHVRSTDNQPAALKSRKISAHILYIDTKKRGGGNAWVLYLACSVFLSSSFPKRSKLMLQMEANNFNPTKSRAARSRYGWRQYFKVSVLTSS